MSTWMIVVCLLSLVVFGWVIGFGLGLYLSRRWNERARLAWLDEFVARVQELTERELKTNAELAEITSDIGEAVDRIEGHGRG